MPEPQSKEDEISAEKPSHWVTFRNWVTPLAAALIIAAFGAYFGYHAQVSLTGKQKRQQAYSELMGRSAVRTQIIVSRTEASIFSKYYERRWHLAGNPTDSLDFQEAQRWMHKSEDLALEIAKSNQSLLPIRPIRFQLSEFQAAHRE
jgi:hypothetical protein